MLKPYSKTDQSFPRWLRNGILIVLVCGVLFRFYHLDQKVYWGDEVYTSIRISGYTDEEVTDKIYTGELLTINDVTAYQRPNRDRDLKSTVQALAKSPEHAPLYYLIAHFWVEWLGNDNIYNQAQAYIWLIRSLSVIISLLGFFCLYWLCWELFQSQQVSAIALFAISPFQVLYAQEAREYSLWTVTILFNSAIFLQAIKHNFLSNWLVYTLSLTLALYTCLFSIFCAIGHCIYSAFLWKKNRNFPLKPYLTSSLTSTVLFSPWLFVIYQNFSKLEENVAHLSQ